MKTTKKTAASKSATSTVSPIGVTDPIPTVDPPAPPDGFVPMKLGRGGRPRKSQMNLASKAATELRKSKDYAAWFGAQVPAAGDIADAFTTAASWSSKLQLAKAWAEYVRQEESLAWKHALGQADGLRPEFEYRSARDNAVAQSLPSMTAFFAAPKESAVKAAATRKRAVNEAAAAAKAAAKEEPAPKA